MSQINESRRKAFVCGGAIAKNLRVKLSGSPATLAVAGIDDEFIGTLDEASFAANDVRSVNLRSLMGTLIMVANGAIAAGVPVFPAASGKVSATVHGESIGTATEATTTDGDAVEVIPSTKLRVAYGQATTVAASDTIVTGLTTLTMAIAVLDSDPVDDPEMATASIGDQAGTPAAGSFLLKTWKNTGGTDPTPAAATTFSKKVNWIAIGV